MKTKVLIASAIMIMLTLNCIAQEASKSHVWTYTGKEKVHTLGIFGGLSGSYSEVLDKPASWFGAKAGVVLDKRWGIGLAGYTLNYDRALSKVVSDGTYHLESSYSGLFLQHIIPIKDWGKFNVSWLTAMGVAMYTYDREFRDDRPWYEETIDKDHFAVNEFGTEFQVRIKGNWWAGINASYRFTSPINLVGADEQFLRNYTAGLSLHYGIF